MTPTSAPLPTFFIPHGGGPWPFMQVPERWRAGNDALADLLCGLLPSLPVRPRAILIVSAHWEAPRPTVMSSAAPPMIYDYTGFPPETYRLRYDAPGSPELAARVRALLEAGGLSAADDPARGFDHGTFIPLMLVAPAADIPVVQLSLVAGGDPATHLALGRALAPLRDEGVLILGSGMSYHNLREFFSGRPPRGAAAFDAWLTATVEAEPEKREAGLLRWREAPDARLAHPAGDDEHLMPLHVAAGAARGHQGRRVFHAPVLDAAVSGYRFG